MPHSTDAKVSAARRCAVFKIDLKGRLVYIDDFTETVFGLSRDELIGRSLFDFITAPSRLILETIFNRHNRYESFYESFPLSLHLDDSRQLVFTAILSLNFIGGNPVNYQIILAKDQNNELPSSDEAERKLLQFLAEPGKVIEPFVLAELLCRIGGFSDADIYHIKTNGTLESITSYPHSISGQTPQVHVEHAVASILEHPDNPDRKFVFPLDSRQSEALVEICRSSGTSLYFHFRLRGDTPPGQSHMDRLRQFCAIWNQMYASSEQTSSGRVLADITGVLQSCGLPSAWLLPDGTPLAISDRFDQLLPAGSDDAAARLAAFSAAHGISLYSGSDEQPESGNAGQSLQLPDQTEIPDTGTLMFHQITVADQGLIGCILIPDDTGETARSGMPASELKQLGVSRAVRAPLTALDAFIKSLETKIPQDKDKDKDNVALLACIDEQLCMLHGIADAFYALDRVSSSRMKPSTVKTRRVIESTLNRLGKLYSREIHQAIDDALPHLLAPALLVETALVHILDNAVKYANSSGPVKIEVYYSWRENTHEITVADSGMGIEPDMFGKVTKPFFREATPEKVARGGSGMGLAIAKSCLDRLGGVIEVGPNQPTGTVVTLSFPAEIPEHLYEEKA